MKVNVRYFASVREVLGAGESVEASQGATIGSVRDALIAGDVSHATALSRSRVLRCAVNQVLCDERTALVDGAELAFFPPVTGG